MGGKEVIWATGFEAWNGLGHCGLEPTGRDAELAELLRIAIDAQAVTLDDALHGCTAEQFVKAFLSIGAPYVQMLRGILGLFEAAGVKQGKAHWRIAFDDYMAEVEQFKHWERTVSELGTQISCPELSSGGWWDLLGVLRNDAVDELMEGPEGPNFLDRDTRKHVLGRPDFAAADGWMTDLWAVVTRAQHILNEAGLDLVTCRQSEVLRRLPRIGRDAFSLGNLCSTQHDYGISRMAAVYAALRSSPTVRAQVETRARSFLDALPRKTVWLRAEIEDLKQFIALPVWEKRHEFYAAWIAAEMVEIFRDKGVTVHSDGGTISFPFRETHVASIVEPVAKLISERRTPLKNPSGAGRTGAVQPDYGWWAGSSQGEVCRLVVEVKHYKKAVNRPWFEVLTDYAAAHTSAHVVLVNYGPAGNVADNLPPPLGQRCDVIGELRPGFTEALEAFRRLVAEHVRPLVEGPRAILLDISASMGLADRQLEEPFRSLARQFPLTELIAADDAITAHIPLNEITDSVLRGLSRNRPESLANPVLQALATHSCVLLVSDESGARSIVDDARFEVQTIEEPQLPSDLVLLLLRCR
jgi:hypothetical protein